MSVKELEQAWDLIKEIINTGLAAEETTRTTKKTKYTY